MYFICLIELMLTVVNCYNRLSTINSVDGYLDICMDGVYQKEAPGPGELYGQCSEWKERNCCYENTTKSLQKPEPWQNFNLNHCGQLSPMCRGHFLQNFCFYECSPNVGPWLVKVNGMESRKERFYKVPLCERECNLWWKDCKHDSTCVKNWETDFDLSSGTNTCPGYSSCKNFTEIYTDATDFCENVFDRTWKVVQNSSEPCMVLNFHDTNPNYNVAKQKAQFIYSNKSNTVKFGTMLYLLVVIMLTIPKM
ncbi:folate receptor beta-like isoform X2 [Mytilus edulis]